MLQFFHNFFTGGAVAQLGARLDGIEEVVGSNPIGSTKIQNPIEVRTFRLKGREFLPGLGIAFRIVFVFDV